MHKLAEVARQEACKGYHGKIMGTESNIHDIVKLFPKWSIEEADALWCAAFVLYCCSKAGLQIPYRPKACSLTLAACPAWEEWAKADDRIVYLSGTDEPHPGDIVIFDYVFCNSPHDHMGIVTETKDDLLVVAEGNFNNVSRIVDRKRDHHIRCYIRIPGNFKYYEDSEPAEYGYP